MQHDPEKYLYDMLSACDFLKQFTAAHTVDHYNNDRGFRSAVERELQIIGEAMLQLTKIAPELAQKITDYRNIIGFRHVLVHGYDSLNPQTVWDVIVIKLPILHTELQTLLGKNKYEDS